MSDARPFRYPVWCRGDLDGFFGLMVDNLAQVLLIVALCKYQVGMPDEFIFARMLPAVAISLLLGNVFYGLQAHWVARRHNNPACTALPYGINTPSVIAYVVFVMAPVYRETHDWSLAWKAGLAACVVSGLIEFCGSFIAERLRRATPRAALLGVLAAIGITFIAGEFAFSIWNRPLVGILPLAFLLLAYFAKYRFPGGIPGGFLAVLFGTGIAWLLTALGRADFGGSPALSVAAVHEALSQVRFMAPVFCGHELLTLLEPEYRGLLLQFLAVSVPMGVINVIGSLQNIESAEAGGDRFATAPSLAVNGLGTLAAAMFGSCFPTTIYIGHPGWKALGARAGYSILNGLFFTVCFLFGLGGLLAAVVPIEAGAAIVVYIGIIITAQAFQATPREHAPAVAISLFPGLGAFLVTALGIYLVASGAPLTLADLVRNPPAPYWLPGLITVTGANSAWIIVTLILTAIGAALIDRRYRAAAIWCASATVLTALGILHAYRLVGNEIHEYFLWQWLGKTGGESAPATAAAGPTTFAYNALPIAAGYALATIVLALAAWRARKTPATPSAEEFWAHESART